MKEWTCKELINAGYKIENAQITFVDLSMADHACLTLKLALKGEGWCCVYGGYCLGHGYVGADKDFFDASAEGLLSIIRIMDVIETETFNGMNNKYVRVATKGWGDSIKIIGNITKDKWFDYESFYEDLKG